ncbi:MAG: hypothetical protein NDI62_00510 [Burkholderiales bacterium]|nr:hypothetical protein [Burkholderiales bacterium]
MLKFEFKNPFKKKEVIESRPLTLDEILKKLDEVEKELDSNPKRSRRLELENKKSLLETEERNARERERGTQTNYNNFNQKNSIIPKNKIENQKPEIVPEKEIIIPKETITPPVEPTEQKVTLKMIQDAERKQQQEIDELKKHAEFYLKNKETKIPKQEEVLESKKEKEIKFDEEADKIISNVLDEEFKKGNIPEENNNFQKERELIESLEEIDNALQSMEKHPEAEGTQTTKQGLSFETIEKTRKAFEKNERENFAMAKKMGELYQEIQKNKNAEREPIKENEEPKIIKDKIISENPKIEKETTEEKINIPEEHNKYIPQETKEEESNPEKTEREQKIEEIKKIIEEGQSVIQKNKEVLEKEKENREGILKKLKEIREKKEKTTPFNKELGNKAETESFNAKFIENKVRELLKSQEGIKKINSLKIEGSGDSIQLSLDFEAEGKKFGVAIKIKGIINTTIFNKDNTIVIKKPEVKANTTDTILINKTLTPKLDEAIKEIIKFIEKEKDKKVEKIWIENGELKALYKQ